MASPAHWNRPVAGRHECMQGHGLDPGNRTPIVNYSDTLTTITTRAVSIFQIREIRDKAQLARAP